MRISIRIGLLFLLRAQLLLADNDTLKVSDQNPSAFTHFFSLSQFEHPDSIIRIENSLYEFHKYLPKNTTGNAGLAYSDLYFNPLPELIGFNYFQNNYSQYFLTSKSIKFYNTRTPYTDLLYVIGTKKEQYFKMTFSYNIKNNWNLTVDFHRIRSEGIYLRQNTNDNSVGLSTNFKSSLNRYWLAGGIVYNSYKNAENGGITNDSAFINGGSVDKRLLDINLAAANKNVGNAEVFLKQIVNFGRRSEDSSSKNQILPESRILITSSFNGTFLKYEDDYPNSGYYSNIYYDSTKTFDSTFFFKVENEVAWKRMDNNRYRGVKDILGIGFGMKQELIEVKQRAADSILNNFMAGAELYNTYTKNLFWWNVSGKYVVNGYNYGDYNFCADIKKQTRDSLNSIQVVANDKLSSPDFIYNYYDSNNFKWKNNFEKTRKTSISSIVTLKKQKLVVAASVTSYSDLTYFDNYAIARQYHPQLLLFRASLKKDFSLFNWHLNNRIIYQKVADSSIIRVPEIILDHSLYYENNLFKKAMLLQAGFSIFYTSSFYGNSYMPATSEFYLQDQRKCGNYPFIDFFVNAQIKTVRIFFKIDHLNSGWNGNNYFLIPDYPYPDRTFKFGVSWKFYD